MPHSPRNFISGNLYEISFRAKKGFPFPPKEIIELLISSALARVQRDNKLHLCHHLWMANHPHIIAVFKDANAAKNFYKELMKALTESIKALLGLKYLNLWKRRANIGKIPDIDTAITRIVYCYTNPTKANLVETIGAYPGYNSYRAYESITNDLNAESRCWVPWIRSSTIEPLHSPALSERSDRFITQKLKNSAKGVHELVLQPNYWMKCFGINKEEDIRQINQTIHERIRGREEEFRQKRLKEGKTVIGVNKLKATPIMRAHVPKTFKTDRQVPIICNNKELRIPLIKQFKEFCALCKERFREWSRGDYSNSWPPGAFRPPMIPNANAIW